MNSSGSVYTNVDYAQDLRNIGIDTDDVWQRKLVSLGYDISFDKDGNLMASKNQVTDITGTLESTNVEWHNALTGQEIEYDSEKQSYYIKPYYLLEGVFGKKIYLKADNEEEIKEFLSKVNTDECTYEVKFNGDGIPSITKNESLTVSTEECKVISAIYSGDLQLNKSQNFFNEERIFCDSAKFLSYFGYDPDIEGSYSTALEKAKQSGIDFSDLGGVIDLKFSDSTEMSNVQSVIVDFVSPVIDFHDETYEFTLSKEEYDRYFDNKHLKQGAMTKYDSDVTTWAILGYEKNIDELTSDEIMELKANGFFVVGDKLYSSFNHDDLVVEEYDGGYHVSMPKNISGSDEIISYLFGDKYFEHQQEYINKQTTTLLNNELCKVLSGDFGVNNLNICPVERLVDNSYQQVFYGNTVDYNNSDFLITYNGHSILFNNNMRGQNETYAYANLNSYIANVVSRNNQFYDDLGFTLSFLIDSEKMLWSSVDESGISSNLKDKGFSSVVLDEETGEYKIYLNNGQYYLLDRGDNSLGEDGTYSISQVVYNVDESSAMTNLNIRDKLNQNHLVHSSIDVRATDKQYVVYIDGEIYSVDRMQIENQLKNSNIELTEDNLAAAIFQDITNREDGYVEGKKTDNYNNFVSSSMFVQYIDIENSEYYSKICDDLISYNDELINYSNKIAGIDMDKNFVKSIAQRNNYCKNIVDVANDCVQLSNRVEHCVNLIYTCDDSLKGILEGFIEEFFDAEWEEVTRNEQGDAVVNLSEYKNFFSEKMDEAEDLVEYYDILLNGKMEIPNDPEMLALLEKYGIIPETVTIGNDDKFVCYVMDISDVISKENNVIFNEYYSLYDWAATEAGNVSSKYTDAFLGSITMSSIAAGDMIAVINERNSYEAFCNTKPYLDYIFSDRYSYVLENVREGRYDNLTLYGSTFEFPEYFTDFQKAIMILSAEDAYQNGIKKWNEDTEGELDKQSYAAATSAVMLKWSDDVDNLKKIVPYSYEQVQGYNEAVKEIQGWYKDGGISGLESFVYGLQNFGTGFLEYPANMIDFFMPETTASDYKAKYMAEILTSASSLSLGDINKMYSNGEISELDKNLRDKMVNTIVGLDPSEVQLNADNLNFFGQLTSEAVLEFINAYVPGFSNFVRAASIAGSKRKSTYEQGYSMSTSMLSGLVSGAVTFGILNYFREKINYKKGNVKVDMISGKAKVSSFSSHEKERVIALANKLRLTNVSDFVPLNNYDDAVRWLAENTNKFSHLTSAKFVDDMASDALSFVIKQGYGGVSTTLADTGANVVLAVEDFVYGNNADYLFNDLFSSIKVDDSIQSDYIDTFNSYLKGSSKAATKSFVKHIVLHK